MFSDLELPKLVRIDLVVTLEQLPLWWTRYKKNIFNISFDRFSVNRYSMAERGFGCIRTYIITNFIYIKFEEKLKRRGDIFEPCATPEDKIRRIMFG